MGFCDQIHSRILDISEKAKGQILQTIFGKLWKVWTAFCPIFTPPKWKIQLVLSLHISHAPDTFSFLVAHPVAEASCTKDDTQLFHSSLPCKTPPAGLLHKALDAA